MLFDSQFQTIADVLDTTFRNLPKKQNNADRGELCELFVTEFLDQFLGNSVCVYRGGQIIDCHGNRSGQIDIVVTGPDSIRFFGNKGLYPIETVIGAICITSQLDFGKLKEDVEVLRSIPTDIRSFAIRPTGLKSMDDYTRSQINKSLPYRAIFGFDGTINQEWSKHFRKLVEDGVRQDQLPWTVAVNKKAFVQQYQPSEKTAPQPDTPFMPFRYFELRKFPKKHFPLSLMIHRLFYLKFLIAQTIPNYPLYFRQGTSPPYEIIDGSMVYDGQSNAPTKKAMRPKKHVKK